mgnify:CR=1 FL=1
MTVIGSAKLKSEMLRISLFYINGTIHRFIGSVG